MQPDTMTIARVTERIDASIEAVWELVSDFANFQRLMPHLDRCDSRGEGVGMTREVEGRGVTVRERLEELDEHEHRLVYMVMEPSPMPVSAYRATIRLSELAPVKTEIIWSAVGKPSGPVSEVCAMIESVYREAIAGCRLALLNTRSEFKE